MESRVLEQPRGPGNPLTGARRPVDIDRVLETVLFTDIVGSTTRAAALGDKPWKELLDKHDDLTRTQVEAFGGRVVKTTGDGALATFDSPGRAIKCASELSLLLRGVGINVRAGLHTGEVEKRGDDVGGIAVHIGARVMDEQGPARSSVRAPCATSSSGRGCRSRIAARAHSKACRKSGNCSPSPDNQDQISSARV